jgi:DNA-directed RNA polymerase subunit RPC12/RpoP
MELPKLSRFTKITLAVAGVLFLVWLGLVLFVENASTKTGPAFVDDQVCPNCGKPLPKGALQSNQCPNCLLQYGPEAAKIKKDSATNSRVIPSILIAGVVILLALNIGVSLRNRLKQQKDEIQFHYHCPKCHRKLRYREHQIGRFAQCPLCERPIVFPKPANMRETRWTQFRRWLNRKPQSARR